MAEALGLGASIIAVIQLTAQLASLSYGYISGVKRASEDIQNLMDELRSFSIVLANLQVSAQANSGSTALQQLKDPLQKCILDMKKLVTKLEPRKWLGKTLVSLGWPLKEKETSEFISRMERHKSLFMLVLETDNLSRSKSIETHVQGIGAHVQDIKDGVKGIGTHIQDIESNFQEQKSDSKRLEDGKKRIELLNWLYSQATDTRHLEISNRRREGTGLWILNTPEFQYWIQNLTPKSRILWGYGIPGAGKTFLSSLVIRHLRSQITSKKWGVAYVYFNFKEQDRQTPADILAILAKQLICLIPHLPTDIKELFEELQELQQRPTLNELCTILFVAAKSFPRTFIVCDALDECSPKSRLELLPLFHQMEEHGMSLFLTSREYPEDIQDSLANSVKIRLWAKHGDIANYIKQKIDENPRAKRLVMKGNYENRIISELTECAKGMFLLVHFHIEYLCKQTTSRQLLAELERLKSSSSKDGPLSPTYDRAMETLQLQPKTCVDLAFKILSWLVKAREVLTLRQLQMAASVEEGQTTFDEQDLPDKMTLLDVCASLVTIDDKSGTIRLAHYTVQEYLLSNPVISKEAGSRLAISCTTFLSFDIFARGHCYTRGDLAERYERYPFLDYAARHLSSHLKECDEALSTRIFLRFVQSQGCVISYLQALSLSRDYACQSWRKDEPVVYPKGQTPLHIAAALGHCSAARLLEWTNVMIKDGFGNTPIHLAGLGGHEPMVRLLLEKGAHTSTTDDEGRTMLHHAASNGNAPIVKLLLENGADILAMNNEGITALCLAVLERHEPVVGLLLEKGADTSTIDNKGRTMLHHAVSNRDMPIAKLLLENGADVLAADNEGVTALYLAVSRRHEPMVRLLLEKGADISAVDNRGRAILHHAVSNIDISMTKLLLENGADVLAADNEGITALYLAVSGSHEPMVRLLLEKGADISAVDNRGRAILHHAVSSANAPIVKLLLENGADVLATDNVGRTALRSTVSRGDIPMAELLLEKGADILAIDNEGETVFHYAVSKGDCRMVELFLEKDADILTTTNKRENALCYAAYKGDFQMAELLLEKGTNILAVNRRGRTALHYAVSKGDCQVAELLLEKGADILVVDNEGKTALGYAVSKGDCRMAELLLKKGADILAMDTQGKTTFHYAVSQGDCQIAELLLRNGADILAVDSEGKAGLHYAVSEKNFQMVELLLEKGANTLSVGIEGKTILHHAVYQRGGPIVELLLEKGADILALDSEGKSALHHAASEWWGYPIVEVLLRKGADILAVDNGGKTALHYAASEGGGASVVKLLLDRGANVFSADHGGKTALHHAAYRWKCLVTKLLLSKGADVLAVDNDGKTALEIAEAHYGKYWNQPAISLLAPTISSRTSPVITPGSKDERK